MATTIQRSFSGGELAPVFFGRVDSMRYQQGLKTCRNFRIMRQGGAENRPGTRFVCEVKDSSKKVRIIPFVLSPTETFELEFGDLYMRVVQNGVQVRETPLDIAGITNSAVAKVTTTTVHGFVTGEEIYLTGAKGMPEVNGRNFKIVYLTSTSFSLQYMDGTTVDSSLFGVWTSAGTVARVYEIVTPYAEAELPALYFGQAYDPNVITLAHQLHAPAELTYTSPTSWSLADIVIGSLSPAPTGLVASGDPNTGTFVGLITASSNPSYVGGTIAGTSNGLPNTGAFANFATVTDATIAITGVVAANGSLTGTFSGTINNSTTADTVSGTFTGQRFLAPLVALQVTAVDALTREESNVTSVSTPRGTGAHPIALNWTNVPTASQYNIYAPITGSFPVTYGLIGFTVLGVTTFSDTGTVPSVVDTAPVLRNPFAGAGNWPAVTAVLQQRRFFANTLNNPQTVWGSQVGHLNNFNTSTPLQDDDAVTFTLRARAVNRVKHLLDFRSFLMLTDSGEFVDDAEVLTPSAISLKQHTYNGSSGLRPIAVVDRALFVQARGQIVRDFGFEWESQGFKGEDLSAVAEHLFAGFELVDWCYQQVPTSSVWAVRDDGTLLGLTYVKEHEVMGWHHQDTDGQFEAVSSVPEGSEDAVYVVVKREINGQVRRYIERFQTREVFDVRESVFVDSGFLYDGRNAGSETLTISGGTAWDQTETLTVTSSAAMFEAGDVGKRLFFYVGTRVFVVKVETFSSSTVITGRPEQTLPADLQNVAVTAWAVALNTIGGLWHLEGKTVSVLGDGKVAASPNNSSFSLKKTVAGGSITFGSIPVPEWYAVIQVGLPFTSDLETLDIDTVSGETLADKRIVISKVTFQVEKTRSMFTGPVRPAAGGDPLENLTENKARTQDEGYDEPADLVTGKIEVNIQGHWTKGGRVFVRQVDPLPVRILAVAPNGLIPLR